MFQIASFGFCKKICKKIWNRFEKWKIYIHYQLRLQIIAVSGIFTIPFNQTRWHNLQNKQLLSLKLKLIWNDSCFGLLCFCSALLIFFLTNVHSDFCHNYLFVNLWLSIIACGIVEVKGSIKFTWSEQGWWLAISKESVSFSIHIKPYCILFNLLL